MRDQWTSALGECVQRREAARRWLAAPGPGGWDESLEDGVVLGALDSHIGIKHLQGMELIGLTDISRERAASSLR